jgi:hypothetical protein
MAVSQSKFYFQPSYNDMRWLLANQNSTFRESIEKKNYQEGRFLNTRMNVKYSPFLSTEKETDIL